jgi:uncharacterized protein YjbI with pentapeptide repeats
MTCCMSKKYNWCRDLQIAYSDNDGNDYCVFHAPKGTKGNISLQSFNELVFAYINESLRSGVACDLSGTIFEGDISFTQYSDGFHLPQIKFSSAIFNGKVNFLKVIFEGNAIFNRVHFCGFTYFTAAKFTGDTWFTSATFDNDLEFSKAEFIGKAYFNDSKFNGSTTFHSTIFNDEAEFSKVTFGGKTDFTFAEFREKADFSSSEFLEKGYFSDIQCFNGIRFTKVSVKDEIKFDIVNLERISFLDTNIRNINFIDCRWPKKYGRNILFDEIESSSYDRTKIATLYRQLKQKNKEEHNEPEVSNWHYGEKEMFRKSSSLRMLNPLSFSNLYWLTSGYGERPVRAGLFLIIFILATSVLSALTGLMPSNQVHYLGIDSIKGLADIMDFRKFTVLILNTFQYITFQKEPFFYPDSTSILGAYIKLSAQILIPIQTALFIFALRNKFRR